MLTDTFNPAKILVLANETADAEMLLGVIERSAGDDSEVLAVAPALNSRLRHWLSDEDDAREEREREKRAKHEFDLPEIALARYRWIRDVQAAAASASASRRAWILCFFE